MENIVCQKSESGSHEKCSARFVMLEKRVEDLEKGQDEEAAFRKTYYQDREDRRVRDALLDKQILSMDKKLDEILNWKAEQLNRPNLLLDGIRDKLAGAVVGAFGTGIVAMVVHFIYSVGG